MAKTATKVSRRQFYAVRATLKNVSPTDAAAFYGLPLATVKRVQAAKNWKEFGTKSVEAKAPQVEKANKTARRKAVKRPGAEVAKLKLDLLNAQSVIVRLTGEKTKLTEEVQSLNFQLDTERIMNKRRAPWFRRLLRTK